jgi:hypothetical protein
MRFQDAVANSNDVRDCYQAGLQALLERDRNRLSCNDPREITGSLHLDDVVAHLYPNATRWDYGIGIKRTEARDEAIWVEVHPADANQIQKTEGIGGTFMRGVPDDFWENCGCPGRFEPPT